LCESLGAKVTFFPVGRVLKDNPGLWVYVYERGFQIENHTFSHDMRLKDKDEDVIRWEIEENNRLLNRALGVNYHMRFIRTPGGNASKEPKVHRVMGKLGYEYMAQWAYSSTALRAEAIAAKLEPGQIILFHAIDSDMEKLEYVLPRAIELGFELVTLNELLDLEPNAVTPLEG